MTGREVAVGMRCKLLVGNFSGQDQGQVCSCNGPEECQLTFDQKEELRDHPAVAKQRAKHKLKFDELYAN